MAEDALRKAILANPDDEAARLVYADALQTEGDPRGELIAVQCELARLGCGPERTYLDWVGDVLADESALEEGSLRALDLGNNPLPTEAVATLIGGSGLEKLLALGLQKSTIDDERLGLLAASPLMSRLRSLDLRKNVITDAGAAALLRAKDLSRLRVLYLGGNALTAEGKKRLKDAKELAGATLYV